MENREAAAAETLPEDMVLEILARVADAAALFRCAAACKRWRALVADPSFLRRRWPEDVACRRSSLLGFFNPHWRREEGAGTIIPVAEESAGGAALSSAAFIPALRPSTTLAADRPFVMSSFVPGAAAHFDRAAPLASHDGLLLVRFVPPTDGGGAAHAEPGPSGVVVDHLAVCDLLAGTCHVLPPLNCKRFLNYLDESSYAILTGDEAGCRRRLNGPGQQPHPPPPPPPGNSTSFSFKVLIIVINPAMRRYDMITYTSGEPSWSAPSKCFDPVERRICGLIMQREAAVCRRPGGGSGSCTAHWLFWDLADFHDLAVDARTGDVSLTKLPVPPDDLAFHLYDMSRLTAAADGTALSLFCLYREDLRLESWTRRSSTGAADWLRTRVIGLKPPEQKKIDGALCVCSGERSGTLLIRDRNRYMYIADVETGVMEKLTMDRFCHDNRCRKSVVSIEMDWPAFFMCRLGGQAAV